jgi:hypothetical protein
VPQGSRFGQVKLAMEFKRSTLMIMVMHAKDLVSITEILLKVALNTINHTKPTITYLITHEFITEQTNHNIFDYT